MKPKQARKYRNGKNAQDELSNAAKRSFAVCSRCGEEYTLGAPHSAFCRGRIEDDDTCVTCGESDETVLMQCRRCGEVICESCDDTGMHDCR